MAKKEGEGGKKKEGRKKKRKQPEEEARNKGKIEFALAYTLVYFSSKAFHRGERNSKFLAANRRIASNCFWSDSKRRGTHDGKKEREKRKV